MKYTIPTIADLQTIICYENAEPLLNLAKVCDIVCDHRRVDSNLRNVLVRKTIVEMLQRVQHKLKSYNSRMELLVVEGYRGPEYQERYYLEQMYMLSKNDASLDLNVLLEQVHQLVALPSVAGHPTGGAIDLTIAYEGHEIDMGGKIADFTYPALLPTYSPLVTLEQSKIRILLHDLMLAEGFAPFYGEWWHFSYGDREWAAFYNLPKSYYSPQYL